MVRFESLDFRSIGSGEAEEAEEAAAEKGGTQVAGAPEKTSKAKMGTIFLLFTRAILSPGPCVFVTV